MNEEEVETMMDGLERKLGPGEFVVALVFAGRVERRGSTNGLEMRIGLLERRAPDLLASDISDPERAARSVAAASVAHTMRECQDAIAQMVGDRAKALLRDFGKVCEACSPLRYKRNGKEASHE